VTWVHVEFTGRILQLFFVNAPKIFGYDNQNSDGEKFGEPNEINELYAQLVNMFPSL
jgi:hypothetical protein